MKQILFTILALPLLLVLLITPAVAATSWQQTGGPNGGQIRSVAIDPANNQILYAGTNGAGVFKSNNGGGSWSAVNSGLTDTDVRRVVIDPANSQSLYVSTGTGVFKSTNGGSSWSAANSGLNILPFFLILDPANSQILYAGGVGVYKSTNGGSSWRAVNSGLTNTSIRSLAIDPVNSQILYAGTGGGVFKSTNGGSSWSAVNSNLSSIESLAIDPANSQILYAGTGGGVFKSTNGGSSWSSVNSSTSFESLAIDPSNSQILYAGTTGSGVFKSTDGGSTWNALNSGLIDRRVTSLTIDSTNSQILYAGTEGVGVFKTTNGGNSWSAVNSGLTNASVKSLAMDPANSQTLYAGSWGIGVSKTTDSGNSWNAISSGLTNTSVQSLAIDPVNSQILYAGTWGGGVFKSTGGGSTWSAVNSGLTNMTVYSLAIDPANSQILYAGTWGGGVFKSTGGGSTWSAVNSGLTNTTVYSLAIDPADSQTLYAGTGGGAFKSTNGGGSWSALDSGLTNTTVNFLAIAPSNSQTLYAGTDGGVFKSTNGGGSWSAVNSGLTTMFVNALAIDPVNSQILYAGTWGGGVFKSTNGGSSWSAVNSGLTTTYINALAIDAANSQTLYAGMPHGGVFKGLFPTIYGTPAIYATVGTAYSFTPSATDTTSLSYSGALPPGLSFNTSTGAITGTPISTGTYSGITITATSSTGSASLPAFTITVAKGTPTVTVLPTATGITFGQALSASTLSGGTASVAGSFAFTTPTTVPATAGSYGASITFTPTDSTNYNSLIRSIPVTVNKATPTITVLPVASGVTFGEPLSLSTLSGGAGSVPGDFVFTNPAAVPPAGNYTASVTFTPTESTNYSSVTGTVMVAVAKRTPTISTVPNASAIISGQALSISSLSGGVASVAGNFAFTSPSTTPAPGNYSAAVTFTPDDAANYNPVSLSVIVPVNLPVVNATCGSSYGKSFAASPATNLCSAGDASQVKGSGPWSWTCSGSGGGRNAYCSAATVASVVPVATSGTPSMSFSNGKEGTSFTVTRTGDAATVTVYKGSSTSFTDSSVMKPNTIYQYSVSSDLDQTVTPLISIRTPLYNGWNIVAVPYDSSGAALGSFFSTTVGKVIEWRPSGATLESSTTQLGSYAAVTALHPGKGYFVKAGANTLLNYTGTPGPASVDVTLKPGWTMIAAPQETNLDNIATRWLVDGSPLGTAIVSGKIGGGIYWWNGIAYDSWSIVGDNPQIEPWKGYWMLNLDAADHVLTITK
ncbi:putative Ig domain-containing protein [Geomonas paludis]|uniref:Ig domain-containing protein n=1 Tax=Geomonas paludis TaxID=2740185 RepID=A0ABY4LJ43_9BACT|nr:putative Ig domain-containing protein [Geomonas paludis]UPU37859.1 putative Ig domain-containing protein [Geomonas paludis]